MKQQKTNEPMADAIKTIADARAYRSISQSELSRITGIQQGEISKLESGERNPSIKLLRRIADGMDMDLEVSFRPKEAAGMP